MSEHAKEPWRWHDELILSGGHDRQGKVIAEAPGCFHWEADSESQANVRRIIACVNFLDGIRTECLEDLAGKLIPRRPQGQEKRKMEKHDWFAAKLEDSATEIDQVRSELSLVKAKLAIAIKLYAKARKISIDEAEDNVSDAVLIGQLESERDES